MIDIKFPKEIMMIPSRKKRRTIKTKKDYYNFINSNLSSANMFMTVYNFIEFNEKYPYRANYDSAIIDRLWFDFDLDTILEDKTVIRNDCFSNMEKMHKWALKHDYIHECRYTGSGFDVTIACHKDCFIKNKKDCIKSAVIDVCESLGIESDAKTLGDIARVCRVTNSYNFKPKAKRFCISLSQEMIDSGHAAIRELAKKQHFHRNIFGSKTLDIRKYDKAIPKDDIGEEYSTANISNVEIKGLSDSVPQCIKYLLSKGTPNYNERRVIIIGLRELSFSIGETKQILQKYLSKEKFYHCIVEEGQLHHLYRSTRIIFPTQNAIRKMKACPIEWGKYCENAKYGCLNYNRLK